jgi:hypothetical protein
MPTRYPASAVIRVTVAIQDIGNTVLQPAPIEFKIASSADKFASRQNLPSTAEVYEDELPVGNALDTGIAVVDGKLAGARILYSSLEPLTPEFGSPDEMPAANPHDMLAAGPPVNLLPHTVFDRPVNLLIPITADVDIRTVGLAYYDGTQWLPAVDACGVVLPGGEGWMVPGSRITHDESSPPLIEIQVYHFSAAQAVVFARFGDPIDEDKPPSRRSGANVYISCFINSARSGVSLHLCGFVGLISLVSFSLLLRRHVGLRFGGRLTNLNNRNCRHSGCWLLASCFWQQQEIDCQQPAARDKKPAAKRADT